MCCNLQSSHAQEADAKNLQINAYHFGIEDGLPDRTIQMIYQGRRGFVWASTPFGLARYDGYKFKNFTLSKYPDMRYPGVGFLGQTNDSTLWVGYAHNSGRLLAIDIFDIKTESFLPLEKAHPALPFKEGDIVAFFNLKNELFVLGRKGKVWQHTSKGFKCVKDLKGYIQNPRLHNDVASFLTKNNETIWLFSSGEVRYAHHPKYSEELLIYLGEKQGNIYCCLYINENKTPQTLYYQLNPAGQFEELFRLPKHHQAHYLPLQDAFLNTSSGDSLFLQKANGKIIGRIPFKNHRNSHLGGNSTRQNELWLASRGLEYFSFSENRFQRLDLPKNYGARSILSLPNGELMVSGRKESFHFRKNKGHTLPPSGSFYSIYKDRNYSTRLALCPAENGKVWMSDELFLLLKYDTRTKTFEHFSYAPSDAEAQAENTPYMHWALHYQAKEERLVLGHMRGISVLEKGTNTLREIKNYGSFPELAKSEVYHFYENAQGIWTCTSRGLFLLNATSLVPLMHWPKPGKDVETESAILHLQPTEDGAFWLATRGDGVLKWHPEKGLLQEFSQKTGLSHDVCYAAYPDEFGFLWVSTNYGINRIEIQTGRVQLFLPKNGLSDEEFNTTSHHRAKDGRLYFGGLDGVTTFHPSDFLHKNSEIPPLVLTELLIQGAPHEPQQNQTLAFQQDSVITLNSESEGFKVSFAHLDFKAQQEITYAYRIEGVHEKWHFTQNNFLDFYGLPYGKFTLSLKATGYPEDKAVLHIPLYITPPFYLKPWFWTMAFFATVFTIWLIIRVRTHTLALKAEKLTQLVARRTAEIEAQAEELRKSDKLKSNFFANISHELRTPLTLILGPLQSILKQREQYKQVPSSFFPTLKIVERNGQNLLSLVEEIMTLSKLEAHKLEVHNEPEWVYAFLHRLIEHFQPQAKIQAIRLQAELPDEDISLVFDAPKLEKIVNNLLSNALKFTPENGEVRLIANYAQGKLFLEVKDTGEGIPPEDLPHIFKRFFQTKQISDKQGRGGTGIGLALTHDLIMLVGGEITVESTLNQGSSFSCHYPMQNYEGKLEKAPAEVTSEMLEKNSDTYSLPLVTTSHLRKKYRVLLVEDNPDMQHYLQTILQPLYELNICYHGQEAIDFLAHTPKLPDLIISDLMMPVMDGFALLQQVKNTAVWREIPLLMLTARAAEPYVLKAFRTGVNDYVTKPFSEEELHLRCKNLILNYENRQSEKAKEVPQTSQDTKPTTGEEGTPSEATLVEALVSYIKKEINNPELKVEDLAAQSSMSRSKLERLLKVEAGFSPAAFIREVRLLEARRLIVDETNDFKLSYIAQCVGMKSQKNFRKLYRERFGRLPSEEV